VGVFEVPVLKLLQRECDAAAEGWAHTLDDTLDLPLFSSRALDPKPWPAGTATAAAAAALHDGGGEGDSDGDDAAAGGKAAPAAAAAMARAGAVNPRGALAADVVGFVRVKRLRFFEAADLFWDGASAPWDGRYVFPPRACPPPPPDDFSVATFQRHIARANAILGCVAGPSRKPCVRACALRKQQQQQL
jgi:hypothetical protein